MARIVVLAHRVPYPPNKGEKLRTFHQIEALVNKGHELQVFTPCESDDDIAQCKALAEHFNIQVEYENLPHKFLRLAGALITNKSFSEQNFYQAKLKKRFVQALDDADAILLTASSLINYLANHQATAKQLHLMDFMDVDSDKWMQYAQQSAFVFSLVYKREAKLVSNLEQKALQACHTCFVISEQERNLLTNQYGDLGKVRVLGNGIDQALFFPVSEKPTNALNLLFSGVMDYKPNIDAVMWFIENCWEQVKQASPNAHFIIAGMNPSPEILKLQSDAKITVTGFVDDIKPYFDQAHIFVAPFRIARGVQNKVLQAMACALPVVTTSVGAEGIIYQADEDLLIADSAETFCEAIISLANSAQMRTEFGQNALNTINKHYAWSSVLTPLTSLLGNHETHS